MKHAYCRPLWGLPARAAVPFAQQLALAGAAGLLVLALPALTQAQTISGFAPTSAVAGTPITLAGTNLTDASTVLVNGVAVVPTSVTATSLVFVVPAGTSGTRSVTVTTPSGTSAASTAFTVLLKGAGTSPVANALAAPLANSAVGFTFSEPVTAATAANLRVYSAQLGGRKAGTVVASGSAANFTAAAGTPRTHFKPGETVSVSVPATVRSAGGLAAARRVYQFTTAVGGPGRGNFRPGTDPAVGTNPVGLAVGDVDGDGDLDLVAGNYGNGTASVRLNGGDATGSNTGVFSNGSTVSVGSGTLRIALGDVDGDGDLDLVTANANASGTATVRLNGGNNQGTNTGVFSNGSTLGVGAYPIGIALGDVDGDGDLDLLTSNSGETTVSVRLNGGDATGSNTGAFSNGSNPDVGGDAQSLAVGDVDGDGDLDLVTAGYYYNTVAVRLNGGDATGSNTGTFSNGTNTTLTGAGTVVLGDVDGDGDLDLLVNTGSANTVRVLLNGGNNQGTNTGVFSGGSSVAANGGITLGDVDGDGDLDLLSANQATNTVAVRLNGGDATGSNTGTFSGGSNPTVGAGPNLVALADLDGDGDLDMLATSGSTNAVSVRLNQVAAPTLTAVAPSPGGLGQAITLTGTGLGSPTALTINGANALAGIISNTGTSLVVRVPLGAAATGTVSLTTAGGTATQPFAVMPAPGNALAFDGVDDYLRPAGTLPATSEFTLEAWVNPTALSNSFNALLMADYFVGGSMHCQFYGNQLGFSVGGNSPVDQVSTLALPLGRWAHVAVVYSASARTVKFYLNGALADARTYSTAVPLNANLYTVGAWRSSSGVQRYFAGKLDELRVYSAALTPAQVQADMASTTPAASLSFYLNFDQGTAGGNNAGLTTLYDLTSAQPATLTNFALSSGNTSSNYVPGYVPPVPPTTPTDANPAANTVPENSPNGTLVGLTVAATGDNNATLTYSLTNNAGGRFAIDATTGVVSVANGTLLDYETATSYTITAQASDGFLTSSSPFTIALTDVNEAPLVGPQGYSTQEDGAAGTVVGTVFAADPDAGQALTYAITAGNYGGAFAMVGNQLQVANSAGLTYGVTFTLTVAVTDNGTPALTSTAPLTVWLTPAPCAAPTAVAVGSIGTASASVSFAGSATATGYVVRYSGGGTRGSANGATSPVALTGLLPNTAYTVTVVSICSRTQTVAAAPVSFTTLCEVPTLAAIADQQVNVDAGQCGASVSLAAQAGGTPAPAVRFVANNVLLTSPYVFPVGTTTVTATATSCGGTATRTFTVTVTDNLNPTLVAPAAVAVGTDAGQCSATNVALGTPIAADNCTGVTVTNDAPATFPTGTTTVTWTATDAAGNIATATQTVTVTDTEAPQVHGPATLALFTERGQCTAEGWRLGTPTVYDACGNVQLANNAPAAFPKGTTTVTWTATDAAGNVGTLTQVVTVTDNERPTLTLPANLTVSTDATQCAATNVALGTPTIADNCPGVTVTNNAPATFRKGVTGVVWTATDAAGNTTTDVQFITVVDDVKPTIVAPAAVAVGTDAGQCSATNVALGTATATDNCVIASVFNDAPATFPQGTTTVTWTATDNSGNQSTATQLVTVTDAERPTIAAPAAVAATTDAGQCAASNVALGTAAAADNCAGVVVTNNAPSTFAKGTTTVTWTATDAAGNKATATQQVTVTDRELPTIAAPAAVAATTDAGQCSATNVLLGAATAADNCTGVVVTNNAPTAFAKGATTVTWTATDASGNKATATQVVTVTDAELPTITAPASVAATTDAGQCAATNVALGTPIAADNCAGVVVTNNAPASFAKGSTTVTWTATDAAGNKTTATQTVTVTDRELPTLVAPAAVAATTDAGQCAASNVALGTPTAADNCTGVTVTNNAPSTFPKGTTTVTWTATDASGNQATATQTVTVRDTERPVLAALPNLRVNAPAAACGAVVSFAPSAGDNCPGTTVAASPASGSTFALGATTVTVTATDAAGNKATSSFTVTVSDVTPPTARTRNLSVALANGVATITAAQLDNGSADACGPVTLALSKTSFSCANAGPNTVTLTVTDAAGNVATAPATVTVTGGAVTPSISVAPASLFDGKQYRLYIGYGAQTATLTATGGVSYAWSPATGLSSTSVANPTFAPTVEGTYTYTVTATSAGGCRASSTVTIVVEDVRCGNNNDKVQVCHNGQVICVASSALDAHLAHGDRLGSCAASREAALATAPAASALAPALAVYPNPTTGAATLTGATAGATVTVLDAVGRVVLAATADAAGTATLALPAELPGGVYVVRAGQQALRLTVEK